jgi:glycosyltransferase involved in cell wall biosynthesis
MKMLFDARWTRTDYHDGISRYGTGVLEGLLDNDVDVTALVHSKDQLAMLPNGVKYEVINHPISLKELFVARTLNKLGADVVFSPLQTMGFWGRKYKLILTLQDIIYYRHPTPPKFLAPHIRLIWWLFHRAYWPQRWLLNKADYVATVSNDSKKFIKEFHLTDREVVVVYNAPQKVTLLPQPKTPTKEIVYMGSFMPYKNVETLIDGMRLLPEDFELHLLSKITPERKAELEQLIPEGKKVVFHNGTNEQDYQQLLARCWCLATASREEGFGLSITEAQQQGAPVVCTDMDIFHEVAGDAALFFDADDAQTFAAQVDKLNDPALRAELVKKGRVQAATFSWKASAKALADVAQKLVQ